MLLEEYIKDMDKLNQLIEDGFVSVREHNDFPLRILNYTKKAQSIRADKWPDELKKCRGLIVTEDDVIKAFGMRKFWNVEKTTWLKAPLTVAEKMDGSLGIVYEWAGIPYVATRGSFHSEMADWANGFLDSHPEYRWFLANPLKGNERTPLYTPHVEIIFNSNRIVVDYDYEDLVLLGYNDDYSWTPAEPIWRYPGKIADRFEFDSLKEIFASEYRPNAEGFVIVDSKGQMKKFKYLEYLELHKAVSNMTGKAIYNKLLVGQDDDFILSLPDEFQDEAKAIRDGLVEQWLEKYLEYWGYWVFLDPRLPRKDVALYMRDQKWPGWIQACIFAKLDGNFDAVRLNVWKQVEV